jgi:hypothetical protein
MSHFFKVYADKYECQESFLSSVLKVMADVSKVMSNQNQSF